MKVFSEDFLWNALRIALSFILLWAFFDKLFGFGFATTRGNSWIQGTSPTAGFLQFGADGIFASFFQSLSGNVFVDILFMMGLLAVGTCLLLGVGIRIACMAGALQMFLIYLSLFPPENNPVIDEHIVYILVFFLLLIRREKQVFGLSKQWRRQALVKKYPMLV